MDGLIEGAHPSNRPAFRFSGQSHLSDVIIPAGQLALSGPSKQLDAAHWPVRGDLAHIRLAGICFVPHYAVPIPHAVANGAAVLRASANDTAEAMGELAAGTLFNVLDMAGGWAWGQVEEDGLVGYLPLSALTRP
jgi:hypothetical protein